METNDLADGSLAVVGHYEERLWVTRLDPQGTALWSIALDALVAELAGEVRVEERLGVVLLGVLETEPLGGESGRERLGARIRQQATHLTLEHVRFGNW